MLEATLYPTKRAKSQSNKDLNLGDENRTVTIGQSKKRRKEDYSRVFGTLDARN